MGLSWVGDDGGFFSWLLILRFSNFAIIFPFFWVWVPMDLLGDAQKPKKIDERAKNLRIWNRGALLGFSLLLPLHHQTQKKKSKEKTLVI